jgi:hypothetical protein
MYPALRNLNFAGSILSVFRQGTTIYVESVLNQQVYLAIFNQGTLLANTTILGNIIYYG